MEIIGFYTVYIREPDTPGEVGSGPIEADVVCLGPESTCDGHPSISTRPAFRSSRYSSSSPDIHRSLDDR